MTNTTGATVSLDPIRKDVLRRTEPRCL